ncbi:MAG TPA: hypothetical protein VIT63_00375 [Nitrospira sp.]
MDAWTESGVTPYALGCINNEAPAASKDAPVDTNALLLIVLLDDITPPFMAYTEYIKRMDFSTDSKVRRRVSNSQNSSGNRSVNPRVLNGWWFVGKAVRTSKVDWIMRYDDFKLSYGTALIGKVLGMRPDF